jgi:succinate dehydrogenase / fumarate reductase membrane anchor subunit
MPGYRTDHSRARGLGAAGHGAGHWIAERVSAIALAPLSIWAIFSAVRLAGYDYAMAVQWVAHPVNAVLLSLLLVVGFWHMHSGMRVIVEDYVQKTLGKASLLIANLFICILAGALSLFAVMKIAFTSGAF